MSSTSSKVAIIDYGMGNTKSIENAINHVGSFDVTITEDARQILASDIIILPGVGAFPDAINRLQSRGLASVLNEAVLIQRKPTLGICLGMQLLFETSEEKQLSTGLGWIPGCVKYMQPKNLRVPHVGWNSLHVAQPNKIFDYLNSDKDFYFVHSLHAICEEKYILAKFDYGDLMVAAVKKDNIVGMQFHPEKSQKNGAMALRRFFDWARGAGDSNA